MSDSIKVREEQRVQQVVGIDVGDRYSQLCVLSMKTGEVLEEARVATTREAVRRWFGGRGRMRVALEVGKHSPWISRLLAELGHEVVVANPRKVRLIWENRKKRDKVDARYLARLARVDLELLHAVKHRSEQAQVDLAVVRARDALVKARTGLINHVRGAVKSLGYSLPKCDAKQFGKRNGKEVPKALRPALMALVKEIEQLSEQIANYDRQLATMARSRYPETSLLRQVGGVGTLTALAFRLTLDDPARFANSRAVGAFVGLVPRCEDSGEMTPQLRISKEGDGLLRRLLVQCGHYILGPFGQDCDLRRHGERIAARGGKNAKKRAAVAVARKLAVLLHHLWRRERTYDPLFNTRVLQETHQT
jgi:transposase